MIKTVEIGYLNHLHDDIHVCVAQLATGSTNSRFWRRTAIRSFFGFLEAMAFATRQHFLTDELKRQKNGLGADPKRLERIAVLFAGTDPFDVELKDNGKAVVRQRPFELEVHSA
jgi:hypothetical protein